jgi:hypothetical protein
MQITGMIAPDDCSAGQGSCGANCGIPCNPNAYLSSYPNYKECSSSGVTCEANTGQPYALVNCGNDLEFSSCDGFQYGSVQDCGPPGGHYNTGGCCETSNPYIVACVSSNLFSYLAGGLAPYKCNLALGATVGDGAG